MADEFVIQAPVLQAETAEPEKAGIGGRIVEGIKGAATSGLGMAVISAAGGALLGAGISTAADAVLPSGEVLREGVNTGIKNSLGVSIDSPASSISTVAGTAINATPNIQVTEIAQSVEQSLKGQSTDVIAEFSKLANKAIDARNSISVTNSALQAAAMGGAAGAAGGVLYGGAKGMLWADRIRHEREVAARSVPDGMAV